ncbi:MAG: hypothetical protein L5656_07675, partial [Thermanaeromonas sp.]
SNSLEDIYAELAGLGILVRTQQEGATEGGGQELEQVLERYEKLLASLEDIRKYNNEEGSGIVVESHHILPHLLHHITKNCRGLWQLYEAVATFLGVASVALTLIILTYFFAVGGMTIRLVGGATGAAGCLGFLLGLILGTCVHELGHAVVLANNGIQIRRIGAAAGSFIGGFIEADEAAFWRVNPEVRLRFNAASIGTNTLVGVILAIVAALAYSEPLLFVAAGVLFFGITNSLPVRPLDGGWVYEDLVTRYASNPKAMRLLLKVRYAALVAWLVLFIRSTLV